MLSLVIMEEKFKKIRQYQLDNDLFLKFIKNNFKNINKNILIINNIYFLNLLNIYFASTIKELSLFQKCGVM